MTDLPSPPRRTAKDVAAEIAFSAPSMIPVAGGVIQATIQALFGSPFDRRTQRWFKKLHEALERASELTGCKVEDLVEDEAFVSAVYEASRIAGGQHVEEKLDMLKAVLEHATIERGAQADLMTIRFLRWVEELDVEHVRVLQYARNPTEWYNSHDREMPNLAMGSRRSVMEGAGLSIDPAVVDLVLSDLGNRGLADVGMLGGSVTGPSTRDQWISLRGNEWLLWITLM